MRFLGFILTIATACAASALADQAVNAPPLSKPDGFDGDAKPLLQKYCYECHGPQKQKAQVRYDQIAGYRFEDRHLWTKVHEQLADGKMPPEDHAQPTAAEKRQLLSWIERTAATVRKSMGVGSTRRLNRRELSSALQDITGLTVDYSAGLPGDGKVAGFDTGAEGLQDAADSVTQMMKVARQAVDGIRFLEPAPGRPLVADFRAATDARKVFDAWKAQGINAKGKPGLPGKGLLLEPHWVGDRDALNITFPPPASGRGVIRLKITASAMKPVQGVPNSHLWVEIGGREIDYHEVTGTLEKPDELNYEVQLDDLAIDAKGLVLSLSNKVEVPYAVEGYENDEQVRVGEEPPPGGTGLFRPRYDRKLPPEKQPAPFIIIQRIEIDLNHVAAWPPASWGIDLGKLSDDEATAKRLLNAWVGRAWRQPATDAEQARFVSLYQDLRKQELPFDDALRATFQSVLLSGTFRYLPSADDAASGQYAIATRLGFMLWGAPPDAELRKLAAAGKLRDPAVLNSQVDRLLLDPRSDAFFRPFVTQWLEMDQPITVAMDHIKRQDFRWGRHLKTSMREETIRYIETLFRENRPAAELVSSDWTLMNDVLAIHYGYPAIAGSELRKVKLRADDPRGGGILGHAGVQSMLCWMGENWVIYRGAWTLRHVLDDPPPPPPLEVPELVPSDGKNVGKPFKELLKQHQADANCSICHRKMDPIGFAFQNFDLAGRWRDVEYDKYTREELDGKIAWRGVGKTRPVDSVGTLPRGETFKSFAEFRQKLVHDYQDDMVRGVLKNLVIYSTGRQPEVDDMAEIRAIIQEQRKKEFPLRDVLKAIVGSKVFLDN
jgi:hypothetical protein